MNNIPLLPILIFSGKYLFEELNHFIVDSNFYYLTKSDLPNLIFFKSKTKQVIFFEKPDEIFNDSVYYLSQIKSQFPDSELLPLDNVKKYIESLKLTKIYTLSNYYQSNILKNIECNYEIKELVNWCSLQRQIKDSKELENIEKACSYTSKGIENILKLSRPNMKEYELVNIFNNYLIQNNIRNYAYLPVCSHGKNNYILHYTRNNLSIKNNSYVLLDIGCKYNNYCSDITRTFPINGKFNSLGKQLYSILLEVQEYALTLLKPDEYWENIEQNVRDFLFNKIQTELGLFKKNIYISPNQITNSIMPHGLGHYVGLDVHDGDRINILKSNMVVTVEPGIYFNPKMYQIYKSYINSDVWNKYSILGGMRIEDTIQITNNGYKNLTLIPKSINEIEKLMNSNTRKKKTKKKNN